MCKLNEISKISTSSFPFRFCSIYRYFSYIDPPPPLTKFEVTVFSHCGNWRSSVPYFPAWLKFWGNSSALASWQHHVHAFSVCFPCYFSVLSKRRRLSWLLVGFWCMLNIFILSYWNHLLTNSWQNLVLFFTRHYECYVNYGPCYGLWTYIWKIVYHLTVAHAHCV